MSSPRSDPEQLLGLARAGDDSALGQLFELYHGYLELLARLQIGRRLQGKVDAADLVQETFLQAQVHFRPVPREQRGRVGELVAAHSRLPAGEADPPLLRHAAARCALGAPVGGRSLDQSSRLLDQRLVAPDSTPSQRAVRREQAVLLADALRQLPDDYREVLILHHLQGLSLPEVARRLGPHPG